MPDLWKSVLPGTDARLQIAEQEYKSVLIPLYVGSGETARGRQEKDRQTQEKQVIRKG